MSMNSPSLEVIYVLLENSVNKNEPVSIEAFYSEAILKELEQKDQHVNIVTSHNSDLLDLLKEKDLRIAELELSVALNQAEKPKEVNFEEVSTFMDAIDSTLSSEDLWGHFTKHFAVTRRAEHE